MTDRTGPAALPTEFGDFICYAFEGSNGAQHLAVIAGDLEAAAAPVLVRVHSSCVTGDIFRSRRCDCGSQLHAALGRILDEGVGVVVYLDQEGRGIGLTAKIAAYVLQDGGLDTVAANEALGHAPDERSYGDAVEILESLDISEVRLLTNNPRKVDGLNQAGVRVVERVPLVIEANPHNAAYLATKASKLGHELPSAPS